MKLYKNVDLCDLDKILEEGILPISVTGNDNWDSGKRASNANDVVYLSSPKTTTNSFTEYGIVLLEVEVEARKVEVPQGDNHEDLYDEYIIDSVSPSQIVNIYIPEIFKGKVEAANINAFDKITFVKMSAKCFKNMEKTDADDEDLKQFSETVERIYRASDWMYFRGTKASGEVFDLYDITYEF